MNTSDPLTDLAAAIEGLEAVLYCFTGGPAYAPADPITESLEYEIERLHAVFRLLSAEARLAALVDR